MTETLGDLFRKLGEVAPLDDGSVQVGDGFGEPPAPTAGTEKPGLAQPSVATMAAATQYGFLGGYKDLHPMVTPKGRAIGFPFPTTRPGQLEGIDAVIDQFELGNHVLFEAGTGYGKSPMEIGVASYFESSYLLIGRNDLVDQWENDFQHFADIGFYKARHRFDCKLIKGDDCSKAKSSCSITREHWNPKRDGECPACPYVVNRDMALSKPQSVMTLSLGMTIFKYLKTSQFVGHRRLLVVDECSELESEIMRFFEFSLSTKTVKRQVPASTRMDRFFKPLDPFYQRWSRVDPKMNFGDAIKEMRPDMGDNLLANCLTWALDLAFIIKESGGFTKSNDEDVEKEKKEIREKVIRQTKNMASAIDGGLPYFASVEDAEHNEDFLPDYTVTVSPLEARTLLEQMFSDFADHMLFVSATTGTAKMFKATHGMNHPLVKVEMPSGFPIENRPIYVVPAGNMSKRTQEQDAPAVMEKMAMIAKGDVPQHPRLCHGKQKGVVHTYNNKITGMVEKAFRKAGMQNRVILLQGGGRTRAMNLDLFFKTDRPMILVSPSAMLGLDLKEDKGRWQIIIKVPYANLGDPSVDHRKNAIFGWYEWQTAKDLIQTFGRIVRSETDWGHTYILDDAFRGFYERNIELFPKYIRDAVRFM